MPLNSLISTIVGSVISTLGDEPATPPPPPAAMVMAASRTLPAGTRLGEMEPPEPGSVRINGKTLPLSPAAQIRNESNLIVMPASIRQATQVRYLADTAGAVWRVWILTPAELAAR